MKRISLLFSELSAEANQKRSQRLFGLIFAVIIFAIYFYKFFKFNENYWLLLISAICVFIGALILPRILKFPLIVWLFIGKILGEISSRIILTILYLLVAFPISLFKSKKNVGGWIEKKSQEDDYEKMY